MEKHEDALLKINKAINSLGSKGQVESTLRKLFVFFFVAGVIIIAVIVIVGSNNLLKSQFLIIKEVSYDFGVIKPGKIFRHDFVMENSGNSPVFLISVKSTCDCLTGYLDSANVAPKESSRITALFDIPEYRYDSGDKIREELIVITDYKDSKEVRFIVEAEIQ